MSLKDFAIIALLISLVLVWKFARKDDPVERSIPVDQGNQASEVAIGPSVTKTISQPKQEQGDEEKSPREVELVTKIQQLWAEWETKGKHLEEEWRKEFESNPRLVEISKLRDEFYNWDSKEENKEHAQRVKHLLRRQFDDEARDLVRKEFVRFRQDLFFQELQEMLNNPASKEYVENYLKYYAEEVESNLAKEEAMEIWTQRGGVFPPGSLINDFIQNGEVPLKPDTVPNGETYDEEFALYLQDSVRAHIFTQALSYELVRVTPDEIKSDPIKAQIAELQDELYQIWNDEKSKD